MSNKRRLKPPSRPSKSPAISSTPSSLPPAAEPPNQSLTAQFGRPEVTEHRSIMVVPQYPSSHLRAKLIAGSPRGGPGEYEVSFALAIPGLQVAKQGVNFDTFVRQGDSLIEVADGVRELQVEVTDPAGTVHMVAVGTNAEHRLRDMRLRVTALNFDEAARTAHDIVMRLLSRWAYLHDVAITTSGMQLTEVATQVRRFDSTLIGSVKTLSDIDTWGEIGPDHAHLLASYREGLSSAEPLWQALSFYKVAEGVWKLRDRRRRTAKETGAPLRDHGERVPEDVTALGKAGDLDGVAVALGPYAGKKFRAAFDEVRASLRNSIAHLDLDADPLAQDNWDDLMRVRRLLPGLRWMSRQLLVNELHDAER